MERKAKIAIPDGAEFVEVTFTFATPEKDVIIRTPEETAKLFPESLRELLNFIQTEEGYIKVKPKAYLGSDNFSAIVQIVRDNGGEYISAGKDSHFRM